MTPTNAARDALEKIKQEFPSESVSSEYEAIEAILTALSAVDFEALGEAIEWCDKNPRALTMTLNEAKHRRAIFGAARLVLSLGKPQKIDPLAGTPDGLVEG